MKVLLLCTALLYAISGFSQEGISITYSMKNIEAKQHDSLLYPMLQGILSEIDYALGCSGDMHMMKKGKMAMYIDFNDSTVYADMLGMKFQSSKDIVELTTSPYAIQDSSIQYHRDERKEILGHPVFKAQISMDYVQSSEDKDITAWVTEALTCDHLIFNDVKELNYLKHVPLAFTVETAAYTYTYEAVDVKMEPPEDLLTFDRSEYEVKDEEIMKSFWKGDGE